MISIAQAAARLHLSEQRVRLLAKQRRIPGARRIGRTWFLPDALAIAPGTRGPKRS
jgi:hypothetical protein